MALKTKMGRHVETGAGSISWLNRAYLFVEVRCLQHPVGPLSERAWSELCPLDVDGKRDLVGSPYPDVAFLLPFVVPEDAIEPSVRIPTQQDVPKAPRTLAVEPQVDP